MSLEPAFEGGAALGSGAAGLGAAAAGAHWRRRGDVPGQGCKLALVLPNY